MANSMIRATMALLAASVLVGCGSLQPKKVESRTTTTTTTAPVAVPAPAQVAVAPATATKPAGQDAAVALPSTQPFQQFKRGAGEGYAFKYRPRSKEDVVKMLRDPKAQKEMRVSCKVWVTQIAEAHKLPFEGCEGAAAVIEKNSDYKVEKCNDAMFQKNWLLVTNEEGDKFGAWHRKCYPDEKVLTYKGQPISSTTCMNPVILVTPVAVNKPAQAPAPKATAPTSCPKKQIALSVWEAKASTFACAGPARVKELGDTSPFGSGHVSRECGPDFRKAFLKDDLKMVSSPTKLTMSHLRGGKVVRTLYDAVPPASEVRVGLPADFRPGDSIRIVPESHTGLWSPLIKPMQSADWEFDHCVTLHSFVVK